MSATISRQTWTGLAAVAAAWLWTWSHLAAEWRLNPQYEYGFAVPLLAGLLLWARLPRDGETPAASCNDQRVGRMLCGVSLLLLLGGESIRQADPFWRFSGWLLHGGSTLVTFGFLFMWGGHKWARTLMGPVLFLTLAVPWPSLIENKLTNSLLAVATRIAVDALNWSGLPALQRGNVIELTNGIVGIDEACSGIQSLLSSLMASIFLGMYLRLTPVRRVVLLIAGVAMAVIGNVIRVILLTKAVHQLGQEGFQEAHDSVGMWASAGIFLTLGLLAWLLRPRTQPKEADGPVLWPHGPSRHATPLLIAVVAIPLLTSLGWRAVAGTQLEVLNTPHWKVRSNPAPEGWIVRSDTFSEEELRLLQFSEGGAWHFRGANVGGYIVHMFWSAERTIPSQAFGHSAQVCLPSAGWKPMGDSKPIQVMVGTNQINGTLGFFEMDADRQAVFQATWRGTSLKPAATQLSTSRWARLQHLKDAYRQRGHEMLTVYLPAPVAAQNPETVFSEFLNLVLAVNTNNPQDSAR